MNDVDVVRRLMAAFEAGDIKTQLALIDPEVVIVEWPDAPDRKTARGHAGVAEIVASWAEAWEWIRTEPEEFIEGGDRVLVIGRTRGKGKGSEIEVDFTSFNVFTLIDGKVSRMEFFTTKEPAMNAAGLTETQEAT